MSARESRPIDSIKQRLTDYARALKYEDLPAEVVHTAKVRVIDTLAAVIAGFFGEPCRIARNVAARIQNPDGATLIGTHIKTMVDTAAFVNSATARYMEINDVYQWPGSSRGHPSDALTAVLAMAEQERLDGRDFITAVVLAYEVFTRFSDVMRNDPRLDNTFCACIAGAVACGKLLRFSPEQLGHCISLAVVPNVILRQVRRDHNSMFKAVAAGQGARGGVFAAVLARAGLEGPLSPFEGKAGWCDHVLGRRFSLDALGGEGGTSFRILDTGIKNRPSNALSLSSIVAAEKVARKLGRIADVSQVTLEIHKLGKDDLGTHERCRNPASREDADHSLQYAVGVALMDGTVSSASFDEAHLWNPELRALMQKIEVVENKDFTQAYERIPQEHHARVTVVKSNGERLVGAAGGDNDDLAARRSDAEIEDKFRNYTEDFLGAQRVTAILGRLWQLEEMPDVAEIPPAFVLD